MFILLAGVGEGEQYPPAAALRVRPSDCDRMASRAGQGSGSSGRKTPGQMKWLNGCFDLCLPCGLMWGRLGGGWNASEPITGSWPALSGVEALASVIKRINLEWIFSQKLCIISAYYYTLLNVSVITSNNKLCYYLLLHIIDLKTSVITYYYHYYHYYLL